MANEPDNAERVTETTPVMQSAFCGSLRSKKFFMIGVIPSAAEDYLDGSNHCWCSQTQQTIGPDGGMAQPEHCIAARSCYNSAFDA
ncbi:MAG TPA: hypothetical protein VN476_05940 [Pyrinomonadaceae bacterium]|jgi:hypothetical protein|nr:hypothetical protein [Pyrinomonadaceae bacterium]